MNDNRDTILAIVVLGIIFLAFGFICFTLWMSDKHEEKMAEMGYFQKVDSGTKLWVKE